MGKLSGDIFAENSDSDTEIKIGNEYAKNYDNWRQKEELNKLKSKYGENFLEDSESSSSSDDEDAVELTEEVEKDFFKTLAYLKNKDPKIYDSSVNFFKRTEDGIKKEKKKKEEPMYLKDYERKLLLEKGGIIEEDTTKLSRPTTYAEEEKQLQEEIIKQAAKIEDEEQDQLGGLLQIRNKTKEETEKEAEYLKWLTGQTDEIKDDKIKTELKPLKDFWNNPKLDRGEKFLKDYILNKRYLDKDDENYVPTYDEIIHDSDESLSDDENEVEKQEEFEHKYNFRFEEPDQEFDNRICKVKLSFFYPRTIEQSLRKTDDRRKIKRAEIKERKKKEKEEKMADIKKLQELKRKEIEEKIEKLKEITGNQEIGFQEDDIEGDFDPEAHDRRMQSLFNDNFYEGEEGDQKPEFPDIDAELEIENWDHWNENEEDNTEYEPHCEDNSFNMDAEYDPSASTKQELIENTKGRKKRKRKSKVAEALSRPKPKYDPNDKNYEKYFDEYYKLDCEDIIGDIPCKFKYREVVPNDFGLTVEEILLAKDKELNRWCSLKKAVQYRPANVEKYDQIAYSRKANNINLKKRIIPSLFSEETDETSDLQHPSTSGKQEIQNGNLKSESSTVVSESEFKEKLSGNLEANNDASEDKTLVSTVSKKTKNKKKKKKNFSDNIPGLFSEETDETSDLQNPSRSSRQEIQNGNLKSESSTVVSESEFKEKLSGNLEANNDASEEKTLVSTVSKKPKKKNKKKKKKNVSDNNFTANKNEKNQLNKEVTVQSDESSKNKVQNPEKKKGMKKNNKRKRFDSENDKRGGKKLKKNKGSADPGISDARLSAYGINPKKFKNKLKYGNKNKSE